MISLAYNAVTLTLPADLAWSDEYDWHPVVQSSQHTTTGALLVESAVKQAGQLITLAGADDQAWITRAQCDQLKAWAALPGVTLSLLLRGVTYPVMFDHEKTGFEAHLVMFFEDLQADDVYVPILRFITV
jgi:hypothetical protein